MTFTKTALKIATLASLATLSGVSASAISYSGSLTYTGGGITASAPYNQPGTSFDWNVTDTGAGLTPGWWRYTYTIGLASEQAAGLSHWILEVSSNVTANDFANFISSSDDSFSGIPLDTYGPGTHGGSNPNIPGNVFGIKFDNIDGSSAYTFTFDSSRDPVWGDFYIKGGSGPYAVNEGFLRDDPINPAANGSIDNHILRPDTTGRTVTPDGGATAALLGIGTLCLAVIRRKD